MLVLFVSDVEAREGGSGTVGSARSFAPRGLWPKFYCSRGCFLTFESKSWGDNLSNKLLILLNILKKVFTKLLMIFNIVKIFLINCENSVLVNQVT